MMVRLTAFFFNEGIKIFSCWTDEVVRFYMAKLLSSVEIPCGHETIFSIDGLDGARQRLSGEKTLGLSAISKWASVADEKHGISMVSK